MKLGELVTIGTLIAGIIGGWLFLNTHFSTVSAMEAQSEQLNDTLIVIQIEMTEDRIYRIRAKEVLTSNDKALLKKLEHRLERLENAQDDY